jgi:site-specific recombinase XerD
LADGPGVCKRARIRELSPHQLRHGFANRFLRESGRDVAALRPLLGHSRIDTTQLYTDEIEVDELAAAFAAASKPGMHKRRLIWRRLSQMLRLRCNR